MAKLMLAQAGNCRIPKKTDATRSRIAVSQVLRLFTAAELEIAVAGEPQFDIEFWKEHTDYKGYRSEDPTVDLFWKVRYIHGVFSQHVSRFGSMVVG